MTNHDDNPFSEGANPFADDPVDVSDGADQDNVFASGAMAGQQSFDIESPHLNAIAALLRDAELYPIAIVSSILCIGLGALIVLPLYGLRLLHWRALARAEPQLTQNGLPTETAYRFQQARGKLQIGFWISLVFGSAYGWWIWRNIFAVGMLF